MYFIPVAASLFSSNIGSGHFVGLAGTAAANGLAVGAFEWNAMVILLVLGWLFLPVYTAGGISTMPEYLRERFGGQRIRSFLAVLSLLLYVFTKISADLFAGSIFIQVALGWDIYLSVIVLLAITAIYAVTGGLKAVIYVEGVQTIIMVVGGFILLFLGLNEIEGGFSGLFTLDYPCSAPQNETNLIVDNKEIEDKCLYPPAVWNNIIRPADDPDFPWPGVVFGMAVGSIWYWCSDQVIVQRTLSAKDLSHGKLGCVFAAVLKVLPVFLMMVPGMISR
jgi:SSS family transporter